MFKKRIFFYLIAFFLISHTSFSQKKSALIDLEEAYCYVAVAMSGETPAGPAIIDLENGSLISIADQSDESSVYCGSWANDGWYVVDSKDDNSDSDLIKINTETGERSIIGSLGGVSFNGMAYDWTTFTMYGISGSGLYTINLANATLKFIGDGSDSNTLPINLACDENGILYTIDIAQDKLYSINKVNGNFTLIAPLDFNAAYAQSMDFDHNTNTCYYSSYSASDDGDDANSGELRTLNLENGETSLLGSFDGGAEITSIVIPHRIDENGANFINFSFDASVNSNIVGNTVNIDMPFGTDLSNLVANYITSSFASVTVNGVEQISEITENDFSSSVTYIIVSEDGLTTTDWTINVNTLEVGTETLITSFSIPQQINDATITGNDISIEVAFGTNIEGIVSFFVISIGATVNIAGVEQISGVSINDFTNPVVYNVIAQDGNTNTDWTVTVNEEAASEGQICETAQIAVVGDNNSPQAPYWFVYTPSETNFVTISSCREDQPLMNTSPEPYDTRLYVFDACENGGFIAFSEDVGPDFYPNNEFASEVSFVAEAGKSYYLFWSDIWSYDPFIFSIEEEAIPESPELENVNIQNGVVNLHWRPIPFANLPMNPPVTSFNKKIKSYISNDLLNISETKDIDCEDDLVPIGTPETEPNSGPGSGTEADHFTDCVVGNPENPTLITGSYHFYDNNGTTRDMDYFKFEIENPTIVNLQADISCSDISLVIQSLDDNNNTSASMNLYGYGEDESINDFFLPPGEYYFLVFPAFQDNPTYDNEINYNIRLWGTPPAYLPSFNILKNDILIAENVNGNHYEDTEVSYNESVCYKVQQVMQDGNSSDNSNEMCYIIPEGSVCGLPISIELPLANFEGTTENFGNDYSDTDGCGPAYYMNGDDVVYKFTITQTSNLSGSIEGTSASVYIYDGEPGNGGTCMGFAKGFNGGSFEDVELTPGDYFAIVSCFPPAGADPFITFTLNLTATIVSLENMKSDNKISIFPNPANESFNLIVNSKENRTYNVSLRNVQSQILFTKEFKNVNSIDDKIDISNFEAGIYYLIINDGENVKIEKISIK